MSQVITIGAATAHDKGGAQRDDAAAQAVGVWARLKRRPLFWASASVVGLMLLVAAVPQAFAGWFGDGNPHYCNLIDSALSSRAGHPFGFDIQGCDLYANVIYGARNSISIGLLVTVIDLTIAVVLGSLAGFYGRVVDALVSRLGDVFFGFPFILGALVILDSLRSRNAVSVSLVLALFVWPPLTRLMRAGILSVKQMDYVVASRSLGARDWWVLRRHLVPNAVGSVVVIAAITIGAVIATEATLTFLGVGLQPPAISWGLQLANAQENFQAHPDLLLFPGLFLCVTVLAFLVLGECLQDALDPRRHAD